MRAMADSAESTMLKAKTMTPLCSKNFTTSRRAPTLLWRKIEKCFTGTPATVSLVAEEGDDMGLFVAVD